MAREMMCSSCGNVQSYDNIATAPDRCPELYNFSCVPIQSWKGVQTSAAKLYVRRVLPISVDPFSAWNDVKRAVYPYYKR